MKKIKVPCGEGYLTGNLPANLRVHEIVLQEVAGVPDTAAEIRRALEEPIGNQGVEELRGARQVVIVVSDLTRPVPNAVILPVLLEKLNAIGIRDMAMEESPAATVAAVLPRANSTIPLVSSERL